MDTSPTPNMVHKEAIMNINNTPPRLTWEQAQAVLEQHIQMLVSENDGLVRQAVEIARKERHSFGKESQALAREWLEKAKEARAESRVLLATLNTMMRGV